MADKFDRFIQRFDNDSDKPSLSYNILFPVQNEEKRLESGIRRTVSFLDRYMSKCNYMLTIVDCDSTDYTARIANNLCREFSGKVFYQFTPEKGMGAAFREGVFASTADVVGYMDIDLSTDLRHLMSVYNIFQNKNEVVMVNASRYAKDSKVTGGKWYRALADVLLIWELKILLGLKASDVLCGFKFFRRKFIENIMLDSYEGDSSWFYIIELLIRTERSGATLVELPVRYLVDLAEKPKTFSKVIQPLKKMKRLKKQLKYEEEHGSEREKEVYCTDQEVSSDILFKKKKPFKYVEGKAVIEFYTEEEKEHQWK